jgi:CRISPR-associated protein Csb1
LGAKFCRCLVSEIVAIDVPVEELVNARTGEIDVRTAGRRTGSRIDPLGVLKKVAVFKGDNGWNTTELGAGKNAKKVRPSEINHRPLDPAAQGHLRLHRAQLLAEPRRAASVEVRRGRARPSAAFSACRARARCVVRAGCARLCLALPLRSGLRRPSAAAQSAGFALSAEPLRLTPQDKLVEIVRQSQKLALAGEGGEQDGADDKK